MQCELGLNKCGQHRLKRFRLQRLVRSQWYRRAADDQSLTRGFRVTIWLRCPVQPRSAGGKDAGGWPRPTSPRRAVIKHARKGFSSNLFFPAKDRQAFYRKLQDFR